MTQPKYRGPGRPPPSAARINAFLHHLGRTGSVTVAARRAGLGRSTVYDRRRNDAAFAERWAQALGGVERPAVRDGRRAHSIRHYDAGLLQVLLRAHRPEVYGAAAGPSGPPGWPLDIVRRLAAARRGG